MLSVDHPDETVCECAGSLPEGSACEREYECAPGNECITVAGVTKCHRLCTPDSLPVVGSKISCSNGETCHTLGTRTGFCVK